MTRNIFVNVMCFLLISIVTVASIVPVAAQVALSSVVKKVPAPEADAGLLALMIVGGVAFLTYWRKQRL
jgi:hypothetical protein